MQRQNAELMELALAGAGTNELVQELYTRFENCIIIYDVPTTYIGQVRTGYNFYGSIASALGLVKYAETKLMKELLND